MGFLYPADLYNACTALVAFFLSVGFEARSTYFLIYFGICASCVFVSEVMVILFL